MKQQLIGAILAGMIFIAPANKSITPEETQPIEEAGVPCCELSDFVSPFTEWGSDIDILGINHNIPEYEMLYSEDDVTAAAQMMLGEAGCSWISDEERMACLWTVCNRVDAWGGTIKGQIAATNQYLGYSPSLPAYETYVELAIDVLTRWSLEQQGLDIHRELPSGYMFFSANAEGTHNVFRNTCLFESGTQYVIFE